MFGEIRRAMLNMVKESGGDKTKEVLRRVTYARGFQDLWYLRGDVLAAVASTSGELLLRPCEVLSGIANPPILEVAHDALRVLLQHRHMFVGDRA